MNTRRDHASPFGVRLYFEPAEFELMMEELRSRAGDEFREGEGVDVDRVLLGAFGIEPDYVVLPAGVLGRTVFAGDGKPRIEIARGLADLAEVDDLGRRRLRTTIAHETGHVACHESLFVSDTSTPSLFGAREEDAPRILCREQGVGDFRYQGEWWEYQANRCMASLLMPGALFRAKTQDVLRAHGCEGLEEALRRELDDEVLRDLSNCFDVSGEAAFYRLEALGFVPKAGQPGLAWRK